METWIIILIVAAIVLFVLEVFIPSGGLLGFLSVACLLGVVFMLFTLSATAGIVGVIVLIVLIPVAMSVALRVFPNTPIGRRLIIEHHPTAGGSKLKYDSVRDDDPQSLIGAKGVTVGHLRPVGICDFDGKRIECLSITGMIDPGTSVVVISVEGIEVRVKPA